MSCDVIVAGAGPAGATSALLLARQGFKVIVVEKSQHPRFHIGESILPRTTPLLRELGIERQVLALPHEPKHGAEFAIGDDFNTMQFRFAEGLLPGASVFNIERSVFDALLVDEARSAGATIIENTTVRSIDRLEDGAARITTSAGVAIEGKILLDASGHSTLAGRYLGLRRSFDDPELQKVAYFAHFEGAQRLPGDAAGFPSIVMTSEGWFWLIALNKDVMSVGFVAPPTLVRQIGIAPDAMLEWAIARCPVVRTRLRDAELVGEKHVLADFSYTCAPFAAPGVLMVGDAACFLDPIFSTGVTLAMMGAREAAGHAAKILRGELAPAAARKRYRRFITGSTGVFWKLIRNYYRHSFRELFMNGTGPMRVHSAVISTLAGQVFPKPVWALRWRLRLFELCVFLQRYVALCPRRQAFSLLGAEPAAWGRARRSAAEQSAPPQPVAAGAA